MQVTFYFFFSCQEIQRKVCKIQPSALLGKEPLSAEKSPELELLTWPCCLQGVLCKSLAEGDPFHPFSGQGELGARRARSSHEE